MGLRGVSGCHKIRYYAECVDMDQSTSDAKH